MERWNNGYVLGEMLGEYPMNVAVIYNMPIYSSLEIKMN